MAKAKKVAKKVAKKATAKSKAPKKVMKAKAKPAAKKAAAPKRPTWLPAGFSTVSTYLIVRGGEEAIAFYGKAFGAKEIYRLSMPGGQIAHAELQIGDTRLMIADEMPEFGNKSPKSLGGTPAGLCIYAPDCDALFAQAIDAGATELRPLADQFYGDRSGQVLDPFGHQWTLATHLEDMTPEEMTRRMMQQPPPDAGEMPEAAMQTEPPPPPPDAYA